MNRYDPAVPKIGIALSGGTLKAAAHVGVLTALEQIGIHAHCVAGTSAGSLVAALYAHGYSAADLRRLVSEFPGWGLIDYGFPLVSSMINLARYRLFRRYSKKIPPLPNGLIQGRKLVQYFESCLENRNATRPLFIVATDLLSGKPIVFSNDESAIARNIAVPFASIPECIAGSCALPGILTPVQVRDWLLVDGAFRHYVPVHVLRQIGCKKIIAVNLYHLEEEFEPKTFMHILSRSFEILLQESIENDTEGKDVLELKPNLRRMSWISFKDLDVCLNSGAASVFAREHDLIRFIESPPHTRWWSSVGMKKAPRQGAK